MVYAKVQIYDDSLFEGTEEFGVQLYIPDHHKENGVQLGDPSHAVIFIKDGKMAVHFILRNTFVQLDELPPTTRPPRPPTTKPPKPSEKFCN